MALEFKFPDIGEGIHEGKLLEWYVKPGDKIKEGDSLMKVETDKVVTDIPCPRTGVVSAIFGAVDEIIHVGQVIAVIAAVGEVVNAAPAVATPPAAAVAAGKLVAQEETGFGVVGQIEVSTSDDFLPATGEGMEAVAEVEAQTNGGKVLATPVARKMARDFGLEISQVRGTGPGGRVMKDDITRTKEQKSHGGG